MTRQKRKLIQRMKNNGFIFRIRAINFISKLNIYQLAVLKKLVIDKIDDLNKKGLIKETLNGQKEYKK